MNMSIWQRVSAKLPSVFDSACVSVAIGSKLNNICKILFHPSLLSLPFLSLLSSFLPFPFTTRPLCFTCNPFLLFSLLDSMARERLSCPLTAGARPLKSFYCNFIQDQRIPWTSIWITSYQACPSNVPRCSFLLIGTTIEKYRNISLLLSNFAFLNFMQNTTQNNYERLYCYCTDCAHNRKIQKKKRWIKYNS